MKAYCDKHKCEYEQVSELIFGKEFVSGCPKCIDEKENEIDQRWQQEKDDKYNKRYKEANIPLRFKDVDFSNYNEDTDAQGKALLECKTYTTELKSKMKTGESLFICGKYGTGKTHLAISILKQALKDWSGIYTKTMTMLRDIRSSYTDKKYTEQQIIDKYIYTGLLVIDEVGVQYGTDNEKLLIFDVINGRYENYNPTVLISNLTPKEMIEYLGERVFDRLKSKNGGLVVMDWESYRSK